MSTEEKREQLLEQALHALKVATMIAHYSAMGEAGSGEAGWEMREEAKRRESVVRMAIEAIEKRKPSHQSANEQMKPHANAELVIAKQREEINELSRIKFKRFNDDECWIHQSDGDNYPESLVCPVVMSAQQYRDFTAMAEQMKPLVEENERLKELLAKHEDHFFWRGIGKLVEEQGEVLQLLGKLIPFPDGNHPDGKGRLRERLSEELGDLHAASRYFIEQNGLDAEAIERRAVEKNDRFKKWHLSGVGLLYKLRQALATIEQGGNHDQQDV